MNNLLKYSCLLVLGMLLIQGCKSKTSLPDEKVAAETIKQSIIENGEMPGGNPIEIHAFKIEKIESGASPNTATAYFRIDYSRYPTSGLPPEYQSDEVMRQTEDHQASFAKENNTWVIKYLSLQ